MGYFWILGVCIYTTGAFGESLGANLQRLSARLLEERKLNEAQSQLSEKTLTDQTAGVDVPEISLEDTTEPYGVSNPEGAREDQPGEREEQFQEEQEQPKDGYWKAGFWCFVLSGIFMSFALFFATTTMLAPLQLFMFLSNFLFAHFINHEIFQWHSDGVAGSCVAIGVIMSVISAPKGDDHNFDQDEMLDLMQDYTFYLFVGFVVSAIIGILVSKRWLLKRCNNQIEDLSDNQQMLLHMTYGALAGVLGGTNVTLTKCTFSLIIGEWNDDKIVGVLTSPLLYLVAGCLVSTYIAQIKVTVDGLESCSAIIVMSTHSVVEETVAVLGGILWFQDYKNFKTWAVYMFIFGQVLALVAVIVLSRLRVRIAQVEEKTHTQENKPKTQLAMIKLGDKHECEQREDRIKATPVI